MMIYLCVIYVKFNSQFVTFCFFFSETSTVSWIFYSFSFLTNSVLHYFSIISKSIFFQERHWYSEWSKLDKPLNVHSRYIQLHYRFVLYSFQEKFLERIGANHQLFDFLRILSTKCAPTIFSSEHVRYLMDQLSSSTSDTQLKAPFIKLLLVRTNVEKHAGILCTNVP